MRNLVLRSVPGLFDLSTDQYDKLFSIQKISDIKVDIVEKEKKFVVHADLPGLDKDNINIGFKDGVLSIDVEKSSETKQNDGEKIIKLERAYQKRSRKFVFDNIINEEEIKAKYENGVLELILPKKNQDQQVKKISIN